MQSAMMPNYWKDFPDVLKIKQNNSVSCHMKLHVCPSKVTEIYTTKGKDILASRAQSDLNSLAPCSHEEADTHLLPHVVRQGKNKVSIHTVDTNVVILAVALTQRIKPNELWVTLRTGSN